MERKEIQLSREFKNQANRAIISLVLFAITYSIILLLSILLTILCVVGGLSLISFNPMFVTIALGIGLASLGILILIFVLKFIFRSHKTDRSQWLEINKANEPELFKMINEIVEEVGTTYPKKVYLSSDVNASVFYDSNFWSMFLPVRKNLQIGMGLVNTVSKLELKAILSHEFGHFSQKSMKIGSYVYNVNQIIFNMLYENQSYETLIQKWANISSFFLIFVSLAIRINEGIQFILRKLYEVVNRSYLALSREMEFNADEIAASINGYEPLKESLLRMNLADYSFNTVLNFYNSRISENLKSSNLYKDQTLAMEFIAEINEIPIYNNLPSISLDDQNKFDKSKLVIKDQWASHPTINERINRLEKAGYSNSNEKSNLANDIFVDVSEWQKALTNKLFEVVKYEGDVKIISSDIFLQEYKQEVDSNSFAKFYNGYYDNKNPLKFDLTNQDSIEEKIGVEDLFSNEKVDLVYYSVGLQNDLETLKHISENNIKTKTFDYDGVRYNSSYAVELTDKLNIESENLNLKIKENDINVFKYFRRIENQLGEQNKLEPLYSNLFEFESNYEKLFDIYVRLTNGLQFLKVITPIEQIVSNLAGIIKIEKELKNEIGNILNDSILELELKADIKANLEKYIANNWVYFHERKYLDDNLSILYSAMNNYVYLLSRKFFLLKKAVLDYQEDLLK